MRKIAIITARGGSKGLPNKNMLMVDGKPLLAYSIEAALHAEIFDRIVLTTDSQEYIDFLSMYPIDFIRRADHLATDKASSFDVLEDVLKRDKYRGCDYFVLLQPTSPLRTKDHIIEACERFEMNYEAFDYLVSVSDAHKPTTLTRRIEEDESLKHFDLDYSRYARQNYAPEYSPNGAFFIGKPEAYLESRHFYGEKSLAYFMNKDVSIDIDDRDDFEYFYSMVQRAKREEVLWKIAAREAKLKKSIGRKSADVSFLGGSLLALYEAPCLVDRTGQDRTGQDRTGQDRTGQDIQNLAVISARADWYLDLVLSQEELEISPQVVLSFGRDELRYLGAEPERIVQDILAVIRRIQSIAPNTTIYILECLRGLFRVDLKNEQVDELNDLLSSAVKGMKAVRWIEANCHFTDKYGKLCQSYTSDGLNLTGAGYAKLEEILSNALK